MGVINGYCPDTNILNGDIWMHLITSAKKLLIVMGDLNVNHSSWVINNINLNDRIIHQKLITSIMVFLNDGSPTRLSGPERNNPVVV